MGQAGEAFAARLTWPATLSRLLASCKLKDHELRHSARGAHRQEDDPRHPRLPDDRGRRSRDGRLVGRQGQLGAAPDPQRPSRARADRLLAGGDERRFGLRGVSARARRRGLPHSRLGVPSDQHLDRRNDRHGARCRPDALLALRPAAPRRPVSRCRRGRSHQDCAGSSRRRLRRDAAAEHVLRWCAQGDAGAAASPTTSGTWSSGRWCTSGRTRHARTRKRRRCR